MTENIKIVANISLLDEPDVDLMDIYIESSPTPDFDSLEQFLKEGVEQAVERLKDYLG